MRECGEMPLSQLVIEIAPTVPPEVAVHHVERQRRCHGPAVRAKPLSLDEKVRNGQRRLAYHSIISKQVRSLVVYSRDGVRYVSLNPEYDWDRWLGEA